MNAQQEVERLLAQIRERAKYDPVIERVSDEIEVLCRGYMAGDPLEGMPPWIRDTFSKRESAFFCLLAKREGHAVGRSAIMDALYYDHPGDDPIDSILGVFVCRMRRKLKGSGYKIETVWGTGWRLVKDSDAADISPAELRRQLVAENKNYAMTVTARMMAA